MLGRCRLVRMNELADANYQVSLFYWRFLADWLRLAAHETQQVIIVAAIVVAKARVKWCLS
jgi:hypothetical protein